MEAQPIPGTHFVSIDENLGNNYWQVGQDSPTASETGGELLQSQISFELNRQCILRQMQKNIATCMNAYSVVLVLLASVTFLGFLQPPGGLDDKGNLKRTDTPYLKIYITFVSSSFHLAVTGILVCMSCMAFVIPDDNTYYGGGMVVGERSSRLSAASLNVADQKMLHSKLVKANNRAYLGVRVARFLVVVIKIKLRVRKGAFPWRELFLRKFQHWL